VIEPQASNPRPAKIFIVAAEASGDRLGAALMAQLRRQLACDVVFSGIGGEAMAAAGLGTLFPIDELSIMGFASIPRKLPAILKRIAEVSDAVIQFRPDILVVIDSPGFSQRVARKVRARDPSIPIVRYVSPTVWAWRPWRARAMRGVIDHIMALLPFEPEVHRRLGGPSCSYVGHPLLEQITALRPDATELPRRSHTPALLVVLPGSRRSEIHHHMAVFGDALARLQSRGMTFEVVLPTLPYLADEVRRGCRTWQVQPRIVLGEEAKLAAFRSARAALAKSGTVTLELALSGVPMVAAYKTSPWEAWIVRRLVRVSTVILANLVLGENVVPEYLQEDCTAEHLASALNDVLKDGPVRQRQLDAFAKLDSIMSTGDRTPAERAADIVVATMRKPA
jgi:lipid-A-disaccharide synthase